LTRSLGITNAKFLTNITIHIDIAYTSPGSAFEFGKKDLRNWITDSYQLAQHALDLKKLRLVMCIRRDFDEMLDFPEKSHIHKLLRSADVGEDTHIDTTAEWVKKWIPRLALYIPQQLSVILVLNDTCTDHCRCSFCVSRLQWDPDILTKVLHKIATSKK